MAGDNRSRHGNARRSARSRGRVTRWVEAVSDEAIQLDAPDLCLRVDGDMRSSLGRGQLDGLDAAVLLATLLGVVRSQGPLVAPTDGGQASAVDPLRHDVI